MTELEENIKEVIVLSDLLCKQDFRACFVEHFARRVKLLEGLSSKLDVKISQRLQLKLLDPLLFHLKTTSNSDDKYVLIQCIIQVLKISLNDSVNVFFDVYTMVFFQILKGEHLSYQPSEELNACVLECCSVLIKNSTQSVLEKVYSQDSGAKFSLGISISVNIVKEERSIKLRLAALNFLLTASKFESQLTYNEEIYEKIADLFMLYLPGILAPLLEVILRDETQHHSITTKALTCWGHILCLVMKDSHQINSLSDSEIVKQWLASQKRTEETIIDISKGLKEKKRSKLWLESAAVTLHPLILKLSELRNHSHPKCRMELVLLMGKLLKNCIRNLKNCLPVIVEVLISSAVDEDPDVCQAAEVALNELKFDSSKINGIFVPVLEENLYSVINKLPSILHSRKEQSLLLSLRSLSGYIKILGRQNRLQHLISLSSTLKKLISVIKISFELEVYPEISNQDLSVWDNEIESVSWRKPWKRFRHFANPVIKNQLEEICHDLGYFGQPEVIFDLLLESYTESCSFAKETLLIMNEIILGWKEIEEHTLNQLLDFYLKPQNLSLPLQGNISDGVNPREAQTNIIKIALIMEGIGNLAKKTGEKFRKYLLNSLYCVLQHMGSEFSIIREAATKSATDMANACELNGSVKSLIENNVDYLTYHVTVKLKRNDESVLDVIRVLIKNSTFQNTPYLEEIINNVLNSSSRNFDSPHTLSYLRLFQIFVVCVTKWMKIDDRRQVPHVQPQHHSNMNRLKKYLESLSKEETEPEIEEEVEMEEKPQETFDCENIPEEPEKPKLPSHLKLTLAIANHCLHYLASKDKGKRIVVLEILNECVWALADWEDHLLPLVHNIWSPLTTKFEANTDALLINRSFTLLCTLAFTSKDFVRSRTLKAEADPKTKVTMSVTIIHRRLDSNNLFGMRHVRGAAFSFCEKIQKKEELCWYDVRIVQIGGIFRGPKHHPEAGQVGSLVISRTLSGNLNRRNVLPVLESFLVKQAAKSKLKDSASGYFFTQNFKLQRELLSQLGKLTSSLGLFEKQTDLVVESALPYLSTFQPRELQEKCKILFEDLKSYDKELVWFKVHNLVGDSEFTKNAEAVIKSLK